MKTLLLVLVMLISMVSFSQVDEKQLVRNDSTFIEKVNLYYNNITPIQKWWFLNTSNLLPDSLHSLSKTYTKEQMNNFCDSLVVEGLNKIKNGQHISDNDTPISCVFPTGSLLESTMYRFKNYNN